MLSRWTRIVLASSALLLLSGCPDTGVADDSPALIGKLLVENLLAREYMYYGDEALHYAEAAAAIGALKFAHATGDRDVISQLQRRYELLLDDSSPLVSRRPHVDMNVIGIVPLQVALLTRDTRSLQQGLSFADSQWDDPLPDGLTRQSRYWIDDLYMIGMLQIQAYRATGDLVYADRAARQLAAYLPKLQNPNGLFYHSPDVPIFWGRGNGWVAVAMAEVLSSLPRSHVQYDLLLVRYQTMMNSLLKYQDRNGMWRQVIDHAPAWPESSATAMFAYAMAVGINTGLLERQDYDATVARAWRGLLTRIDADGNVSDVCIGTGKKDDLQYYLDRPKVAGDLHGQAPLLWLATELLESGHRP